MRLRDYDYSTPGIYFVTICIDDRRPIFGTVADGAVVLSPIGEIALARWAEIPEKWKPVEHDVYVIMPNHVHGILLFPETGEKLPDLGDVMNWYKAMVTKAIRRMTGDISAGMWQRRYHDRVVRNEHEHAAIRTYIERNPGKWEEDEYYSR